jgi:hypothetical protein
VANWDDIPRNAGSARRARRTSRFCSLRPRKKASSLTNAASSNPGLAAGRQVISLSRTDLPRQLGHREVGGWLGFNALRSGPGRALPILTRWRRILGTVSCWTRLAEVCCEHLKKARSVRVVGRLRQDRCRRYGALEYLHCDRSHTRAIRQAAASRPLPALRVDPQ